MNRIALVTGVGRKRGIGAAICFELAKQGHDIFFTYWGGYDVNGYPNSIHDPAEIESELKGLGIRVESSEVDLSKSENIKRLFSETTKRLGMPDILVNNAAVSTHQSILDVTAEVLDDHYAVNVRATTLLCIEFAKQGRPGKILNLTSGQSLGAMKDELAYTITKAGAEMLVTQLAPELSKIGISINAFDPGPTDTGWISDEMRASIARDLKIHTTAEVAKGIVDVLNSDLTSQVVHFGR